MPLPYASIASLSRAVGVPHCMGVVHGRYCGDISTFEAEHRRGFVRDGTVHMSERRVNRSVIRLFCMLVAEFESFGVYDDMEPWERRWRMCVDAERVARLRLHVRLPRALWDVDRWSVRAQLVHVPTATPGRREAMAWSSLVIK